MARPVADWGKAAHLADTLRALAHPVRLRIVGLCAENLSVTVMAEMLDVPQAMDDQTLSAVSDAAWSCTGCRRCMVWCPFRIDTQMIMSIAKLLLIGADKEPKLLTMLADMSIAKGETTEETKASFDQAVLNLASEIESIWPASPEGPTISVGAIGADVLYVPLAGKHSIIPAAAIMNAAGEKWTLSRFEAVNFAAFLGDSQKMQRIVRRIHDEAIRLQAKEWLSWNAEPLSG
jgi:Fe-S oxidoreductase